MLPFGRAKDAFSAPTARRISFTGMNNAAPMPKIGRITMPKIEQITMPKIERIAMPKIETNNNA